MLQASDDRDGNSSDAGSGECVDLVFPACWNSSLEFIGYMYVDTPLNLMGIITNILNLLVLCQRPFRVRVTAFSLLRAMAVSDLLACSTIFPIGFCRCFPPGDITWQVYMRQFYDVYIYLPLANCFGSVSVLLTMVVSIERYMLVAFPVTSRLLWSKSRARKLILAVYLGSFVLHIPYFFLREIAESPPPQYTDWGNSNGASVYFFIRTMVTRIIPITTVVVVNAMLLRAIWRMNQKHKKQLQNPEANSARSQMQMRATFMVVSISLVFLLCHALEPFVQNAVFGLLFGECSIYSRQHRIFIVYCNSMETFTYASNFFFYCLFNKHFSSALKTLCKCPCNKTNRVRDLHQEPTVTVDSVMRQ